MSIHGDHDMGHTVAGWTGTALAFTGSLVAGAGFVAGSAAGLWGGGVLVLLAAVATWLLHLAGWGKPGGVRPPGARDWRTRDAAARHGHPDCLGCRLAGRRGGGRVGGRVPGAGPKRGPASVPAPAFVPVADSAPVAAPAPEPLVPADR